MVSHMQRNNEERSVGLLMKSSAYFVIKRKEVRLHMDIYVGGTYLSRAKYAFNFLHTVIVIKTTEV